MMPTESVRRGDLLCLVHPDETQVSGYGLVVTSGCPRHLAGLLMVDRPRRADPAWLAQVEATFGQADLYAMTPTGERGLACRMWVEAASLVHVQPLPGALAQLLQVALLPLLVEPPLVQLDVAWDATRRLWVSAFHRPDRTVQPRPRFALGQVVATPGALAALTEAGQRPQEFLQRHVVGEWGDLDEHDRQANERAVCGGERLLSVYHTRLGIKLYVITEWDRSATTLLLSSEY